MLSLCNLKLLLCRDAIYSQFWKSVFVLNNPVLSSDFLFRTCWSNKFLPQHYLGSPVVKASSRKWTTLMATALKLNVRASRAAARFPPRNPTNTLEASSRTLAACSPSSNRMIFTMFLASATGVPHALVRPLESRKRTTLQFGELPLLTGAW